MRIPVLAALALLLCASPAKAVVGGEVRTITKIALHPNYKHRKAFARNRPGTGERFDAARMVCGIDVDGKPPLSSGCFGDSGGPWIAGTTLIGVVSWGGDRCGADHSPSVFADVAHYRSFIASSNPGWTA